jgi:hypothetical protein
MRKGVLFLMPLLMTGCFLELLGTTAIQGQMQKDTATVGLKALKQAEGMKADIEVQHAIQAYRAETGSNPPSLEALVPKWLAAVPTTADGSPYGYDPATGMVYDGPVRQPSYQAAAAQADAAAMARIREAINAYGTATQYYPPTLQTLVPQYLGAVPKTASGKDFIYDMTNGALVNPDAVAQQPTLSQVPQQRRPTGGGGVGPMGEMMTGIGMQQELNNMSSAGSSAAGSRMRGQSRNVGTQQTDKQNKAMDDLGL